MRHTMAYYGTKWLTMAHYAEKEATCRPTMPWVPELYKETFKWKEDFPHFRASRNPADLLLIVVVPILNDWENLEWRHLGKGPPFGELRKATHSVGKIYGQGTLLCVIFSIPWKYTSEYRLLSDPALSRVTTQESEMKYRSQLVAPGPAFSLSTNPLSPYLVTFP